MPAFLHNITRFYHYVNVELADPMFSFLEGPNLKVKNLAIKSQIDVKDPRTNDFAMVSSPWPIIILLLCYYRFVRKWGPEFMKNRPAYDLKTLIVLYNVIQIYASARFLYMSLTIVYLPGYYSVTCQKIITDDTPLEIRIVSVIWTYYIIKILDLLDTIFFILRKKFTQASFLHVYHHIGMCLLCFIGTKYVPGGHGVMLGVINSGVHTVMYSYYLVSAVHPQWIRRWWKKYITQLQILQFLLLSIHFGHVLFDSECEYPKWVSVLILPQLIFILILFSDFYLKEYVYKSNNKVQ